MAYTVDIVGIIIAILIACGGAMGYFKAGKTNVSICIEIPSIAF